MKFCGRWLASCPQQCMIKLETLAERVGLNPGRIPCVSTQFIADIGSIPAYGICTVGRAAVIHDRQHAMSVR